MTKLSSEKMYKALIKEIEDSIMIKYAIYVSRCLYEQGVPLETIFDEVLFPLVNINKDDKINKYVDISLGK